MGIEALEAMLMDDEFRGAPPFLSFRFFQSKQTNDMQWQKFILARVASILLPWLQDINISTGYVGRLFIMVLCFFYSPEFGHVLMPCSFSCAVLSVLFSVGKGGEQGAVSSIKIYIWFAVWGVIRVNIGLLSENSMCFFVLFLNLGFSRAKSLLDRDRRLIDYGMYY